MAPLMRSPFAAPAGGGGFEQGDIFIRGVGAYEAPLNENLPQRSLAKPPIVAGDNLITVVHGVAAEVSGNWTAEADPGSTGTSFKIWHRLATGDANDDFILPASATANHHAVMFSLGSIFPFAGLATVFQGGFANAAVENDWEVSFIPTQTMAMAANTAEDPHSFAMLYAFAVNNNAVAPQNPTAGPANNPQGCETILALATEWDGGGGIYDSRWTLIQFQYRNPSTEYDAFIIPHTPGGVPLSKYSQYRRYDIDV